MTGLALLSDKLSVTNELRLKNDEKKMFWFIPPSCGAERKTLIDVTLKFY